MCLCVCLYTVYIQYVYKLFIFESTVINSCSVKDVGELIRCWQIKLLGIGIIVQNMNIVVKTVTYIL